MKKILFIIEGLNGGGAEKVFINLLNNLDPKKFDITLVLLFKEGVYLNNIPNWIKVVHVFKETKSRILRKLKHYILMFFSKNVYKRLIRDKYDYEISFLEGLSTKFVYSSNNLSSKKIAWIHTDMINNHWTKRYFIGTEESIMYNNLDKLVFVSQETMNKFYKKFPNVITRGRVLYNVIDTREIIKKSHEYEIEDCIDIIYIGRLCHVKGVDILLKAFKKLIDDGLKLKLSIVGEGELKQQLINMTEELNLNEYVRYEGFLKNPYPYLKKAKLFVLSSRTEGFPTVLCEALTLNKLIVSTKCPGTIEILKNGEYGYLVNAEDIEELYKAIKYMLLDELLSSEFYNKVDEAKKEFDIARRIEDFSKMLEEINNL
ncbi:glycosyltransferase [Clostridium sp.]|uniref:glycosyltransferase n=1 Tax=Clostridium sp. TaxID=1506 RepID=UPI003217A9BC